ncbi:MAG TPA: class I SAM-dependent methyltransferase [Draconibacterium sp.]|nr:class I SAM-dependent methyltransferase [Draconibacterium sp.]
MRLAKLTEIIHCLNCGQQELKQSVQTNELVCENCNNKYGIQLGVPILLAQINKENTFEPDIHRKQGTVFNYIDHYQKDGQECDYFEERDAGTEHADRRVREYIISQIQKKTGKILDVGCGSAWVASKMCPRNYEVFSMDISLENTSGALEKYPFENHSAVVADVFSLPFNNNVFDYIIASEIIEHVIDPVAFVQNLIRILKPGGTLIVTTPYKEKIRYSLCVHCNKPTPLFAHIHSFDEKKLLSLYQGSNLKSSDYYTFVNKIAVHLRMHVFLKYFNFSWWQKADHLLNAIYNVPLRILVKWEKK